jgi:hypothetical protein
MNIRKLFFFSAVFLFLTYSGSSAQILSYKDIINQYDPFTLTFNDMTIYTNDEDYKEHVYAFVITTTIGNEKVIKFIYKDDILINWVKSYDEIYGLNITVKKNNTILFPAIFNIPSNASTITIKFQGFSNINELDQALMGQLSTSFCYTSSTMYNYMEYAYKYISSSPDINRPNNSLLTTAEVLAQNIKTRPGVFYFGNPLEVSYVIPLDPKKVIGSNVLIQGKKTVALTAAKYNDTWNITFTKYTDVNIVKNEPYYIRTKGVFQDLTSQTIISPDRREGFLAKAQEILDKDLVVGLKQNVYLNDQAATQLSNLLYLLKAGVRVKADTVQTTNEVMFSAEREAVSYFETNLKENDFALENQYVFDDYIASSVNRGIIQKELDLIKRYYQLK